MINNHELKIYDGVDEIIFSGIFNIYENEFIFDKIGGYKLNFLFQKDSNETVGKYSIQPDESKKVIKIYFTNFGSVLGMATTSKISLMTLTTERGESEIFFSMFGSIVNEDTKLLQVTFTLYARHKNV